MAVRTLRSVEEKEIYSARFFLRLGGYYEKVKPYSVKEG